jgi:hypothetical protein
MEQDDGRFGRGQQSFFGRTDPAKFSRHGCVSHHEGQGFVGPGFRFPQTVNGRFHICSTSQVETTQPFDGYDTALIQIVDNASQSFVAKKFRRHQVVVCLAWHKPHHRAAVGTSNGLGMEAPVVILLKLSGAGRTKGEMGQGRQGTVIGQGFNDSIARAAMGAVREGIMKAAIARRCQFAEAFGANCHIG